MTCLCLSITSIPCQSRGFCSRLPVWSEDVTDRDVPLSSVGQCLGFLAPIRAFLVDLKHQQNATPTDGFFLSRHLRGKLSNSAQSVILQLCLNSLDVPLISAVGTQSGHCAMGSNLSTLQIV